MRTLAEMRCRKCSQDTMRLLLFAMMKDAGARMSPSPEVCPADGGEHDFSEPWSVPQAEKPCK